jgi:hypothetical protein
MKLDDMLQTINNLNQQNKEYARKLEEVEITNQLLQNKINKLRLLIESQLTIVDYKQH